MTSNQSKLTHRIGALIRHYRLSQGISSKALAESAGISRYTLSQIEQGKANPTVDTLWKIADGLQLPFASLMSAASLNNDFEVKPFASLQEVRSPDEAFSAFPSVAQNSPVTFETYISRLAPNAIYRSRAHRPGVTEIVTVIKGNVQVHAAEISHRLDLHDSIRFRADQPHAYENRGADEAWLHIIVQYTPGM